MGPRVRKDDNGGDGDDGDDRADGAPTRFARQHHIRAARAAYEPSRLAITAWRTRSFSAGSVSTALLIALKVVGSSA